MSTLVSEESVRLEMERHIKDDYGEKTELPIMEPIVLVWTSIATGDISGAGKRLQATHATRAFLICCRYCISFQIFYITNNFFEKYNQFLISFSVKCTGDQGHFQSQRRQRFEILSTNKSSFKNSWYLFPKYRIDCLN